MDRTFESLEDMYKNIKSAFRQLEAGEELTVVVRYGNEYVNTGQFYQAMRIVKSKGRFRNPDNYRKDWTIKSVVSEIEWYKDHYFHSVVLSVC